MSEMTATTEALALLNCMWAMSEHHYSAGWLSDLEHILWAHVVGTAQFREEDDYNRISPEEVTHLRELANEAQGWWIYDDSAPGLFGERFVDTSTWLAMYDEKKSEIWK